MASYPVPDLSPLRKDPETSLSLEESVIICQVTGHWRRGIIHLFLLGWEELLSSLDQKCRPDPLSQQGLLDIR